MSFSNAVRATYALLLPHLPFLSSNSSAAAESDAGGSGGGKEDSILTKLQHYSTECHLDFLRSPVQIEADQSTGRVASVRLELNKLEVSLVFILLLHFY